jgi:hypothetical protein
MSVQELANLLIVDGVGLFDLAVQMWCARLDVHVADVECLEMPVELGLKLGIVVRRSDVYPLRRLTTSFGGGAVKRRDYDQRAFVPTTLTKPNIQSFSECVRVPQMTR